MTIERKVRALRHDLGGQEVIWSKQFTLQTKTEARNTKLREKKGKKKVTQGFFSYEYNSYRFNFYGKLILWWIQIESF